MTDQTNAFDKLTLRCGDFIKNKIFENIKKANETSDDKKEEQVAFITFLMDWCEVYKHYRWSDQATHLRLWTQVRQNSFFWNFIFGDMQTIATAISTANSYAEEGNPLKGQNLVSIVTAYYSAGRTGTYSSLVGSQQTNDSAFLMSVQECQLMEKSDEYFRQLKDKQSWVFVFLFMIECFTLNYSLIEIFSDSKQDLASLKN